ncbi:MAG TPA: hypothetical protein VJV79_04045 [Polyangiaceae bacterium]|nr:hypothetical protein [Polyangiaceae bacterium]
MKNALKFLSGSAATYFLMAACADAPKRPRAKAAGGDQQMAMGGTTSSGGTASPDGMIEAGWGGAGAADLASGAAGVLGTMMDPVRDASAEPATDGTRLKAVYMVGADGSRQQQYNWWDSERKEDCSFMAFADGSTHCVPSVGASSGSFFSDSGCSTPLFAVGVNQCQAGAAKYGLGALVISCNVVTYPGIYSLKSVVPAQVFQGTPAACTASAASTIALYTFYTGTQIPLSSFVSATKEHG